MLKKLSKRLSLSFTLLLFGSLVCSSGAAVIAVTTTEPVTEESQLIKSPEESLPEAPPVLDVPETTNEDTETKEVPAKTQETQEASEETEAPDEVEEETKEATETTKPEEKSEKDAKRIATQSTDTDDFNVTGGNPSNDYTYADHVLTFTSGGQYRVSGTTTEDRIVIAATNVTLTLAGVDIDVHENDYQAALLIEGNATATIDLVGTNVLKSGRDCAGLQNNNQTDDSLVITSAEGAMEGYAGSLAASGGNAGSGIGGGYQGNGTVTIEGGTVTASGDNGGSGIGGGERASGTVTIEGGTVAATGKSGGSGIGGGFWGNGTVTIEGGTVTASGATGGSGVGGGFFGTGTVTIEGGSVKAMYYLGDLDSINPRPKNSKSEDVALCNLVPFNVNDQISVDGMDYQVDGPHEGDSKAYLYLTKDKHEITVENNGHTQKYAVRWDEDANKFVWDCDFEVDNDEGFSYVNNELILGGNDQTYNITMREGVTTTKKDRIKVEGSNITVKLNDVKIDLSGGTTQPALLINSNASATVELVGENKLLGGLSCAGLQNDNETENSLIIDSAEGMIQGYAGSLTATGSFGGAGIGGANEKNGTVSITGGSITATGSSGGAGIGGGNDGTGMITISAGKIIATGNGTGSGIGGGNGESGTITIKGGNIKAIGGNSGGSGIGGGSSGNGTVTITDGSITATGNSAGSGIGGGSGNTNGTVTINGGKTTATGGAAGGAGIGGGSVGVGTINITGGTITATAGKNASGIGKGQYGNGGKVTISGGSVKASADGKFDSINPRPKNADDTDVALCNLISFKENDQILVGDTDYKVNGPHKEDDKAHLYMTKENHKVTVINNGQQKDYFVFWDEQANKFILWNSELIPDHFTGASYADGDKEVILAGDDETYNFTMREDVIDTTTDRIKVTGSNVTVRLNGVKINVPDDNEQAAFLIEKNASAKVDLFGENELKGGPKHAGLQNNNETGNSLIITSEAGLYDGYAGSLTATGGEQGSGIGGGDAVYRNSNVRIDGGKIVAAGGNNSAGIGGGYGGNGTITINGGSITATGGQTGSGIGSGYGGNGTITINGGSINATGGEEGSGIGSGSQGNGTITINGGSITATGGQIASGIGSGYYGVGKVTINKGIVTATGGFHGTGIGGGQNGSGEVTINDGFVTAKGYGAGAGIGGGYQAAGKVTINGGTISATGGVDSTGIGNGQGGTGGKVTINSGTVKALAADGKTIDSIDPRPENTDGNPVQLYQVDASSYTGGSPLKVGTTDWKVAGKHANDNNFYLYLPEEKHVVTVADNESFIEWKKDAFFPASTYTLSIPPTVELKEEGNTKQVKLTNEFHEVPGYNKQVTASLSTSEMIDQNLILKNSGDKQKQAHSLITYAELTLPKNSKEEKTELKFGKPIGTTGNDPLQAGTYKGTLTFETEMSDEEVRP